MNAAEWREIGLSLYAAGKHHAAVAALERAVQKSETIGASLWRELAVTRWAASDREGAMQALHCAVQCGEDWKTAATCSDFLMQMGDNDGAVKWLNVVSRLKPDEHIAHYNRSLALIASGDWDNGWPAYEARMDWQPHAYPEKEEVRRWTGERLQGKLLWVASEQGLGDQIMCSRYIPWLRSKGATIIFDSRDDLVDFTIGLEGVATRNCGAAGHYHIPSDPERGIKPDYWCALMSLPALHGTTQKNVPAPLTTYRSISNKFRVRIPGDPAKKKIGLVWAGNKNHPGDKLRSVPFEAMLHLVSDDRFEFYSFQANDRREELTAYGGEHFIKQLPTRLWSETGAQLLQMDALVTVDTAIAHFAGSLGLKTFMMVATEPDFRWGMKGATTPWYASVKIIRQESRGDWYGVIRRVASEIAML